jgi:hypothetical protein
MLASESPEVINGCKLKLFSSLSTVARRLENGKN